MAVQTQVVQDVHNEENPENQVNYQIDPNKDIHNTHEDDMAKTTTEVHTDATEPSEAEVKAAQKEEDQATAKEQTDQYQAELEKMQQDKAKILQRLSDSLSLRQLQEIERQYATIIHNAEMRKAEKKRAEEGFKSAQ